MRSTCNLGSYLERKLRYCQVSGIIAGKGFCYEHIITRENMQEVESICKQHIINIYVCPQSTFWTAESQRQEGTYQHKGVKDWNIKRTVVH